MPARLARDSLRPPQAAIVRPDLPGQCLCPSATRCSEGRALRLRRTSEFRGPTKWQKLQLGNRRRRPLRNRRRRSPRKGLRRRSPARRRLQRHPRARLQPRRRARKKPPRKRPRQGAQVRRQSENRFLRSRQTVLFRAESRSKLDRRARRGAALPGLALARGVGHMTPAYKRGAAEMWPRG
jgi:hypothetical protein